MHEDPYAAFQSDYVVYHDDSGDYSTNEPTTDGTASLVYLMAAKESEARSQPGSKTVTAYGGIIRGDTTQKNIALVFTGDEFGDGIFSIAQTLRSQKIHGSFFLTGNFYRNPAFKTGIQLLQKNGNYLGSHSDRHPLYCDWTNRDSLLISREQFLNDLTAAYAELKKWDITPQDAPYFLPAYEWYNDSIAAWTKSFGLQLVNFTPGTRSNADYTFPKMGKKYVSSDTIYQSILRYEKKDPSGLNGFILLLHIGTDPDRTDHFYKQLPQLISTLREKGYHFLRIDELLNKK